MFTHDNIIYPHPLNNQFRESSIADVDIDSLTLGVNLQQFVASIDDVHQCTLYSKCSKQEHLRNYTLLASLGGYEVYCRLTRQLKVRLCEEISKNGPLAIPSQNLRTFLTGTVSCNCHTFTQALQKVGFVAIVLQAYGMKAPIGRYYKLMDMQVHIPRLEVRVDIGVTAHCDGIPLFYAEDGNTHPMLFMAGYGFGSSCTTAGLSADCRAVTYPRIVHFAKALMRMPSYRPRLNNTIIRKKAIIERVLHDLEREEENLYGYRVEYQYRGEGVKLEQVFVDSLFITAKLPQGVKCCFLADHTYYCKVVESFLQHVKNRRLFNGRRSAKVRRWRVRLYFQLLNCIGFWDHKLAFHVQRAAATSLPPFFSSIFNSSSAPVIFPRRASEVSNRVASQIEDAIELDEEVQSLVMRDIARHLLVQPHPLQSHMVATWYHGRRRGVTRPFSTIDELHRFVYIQGGEQWRTIFKFI